MNVKLWTLRIERVRLVTLAVVAVMLTAALGSLLALGVALYHRSLTDARSVAVALEQYALRTLVTGDLLAEVAKDAVLRRGNLDGIGQDGAVRDMLIHLTARLPQGSGMIVVDPLGKVVASDKPLPTWQIDLSDRAWFHAHKEKGIDLVVSEALLSRVSGAVMFLLTRAVRDDDGTLLAVINLGVPSGSLIGEHALPQYGDGVTLTLLNDQGGLLARSDFPTELIGLRFDVTTAQDNTAGLVQERAIDARMAIEANEVNTEYGFIARSSIPATEVFAPLLTVAGFGLPILGLMLAGTVMLLRSITQQNRLLTQTSARLEAVLEASHLGSWHLHVPTMVSDMNARWARMLGHQPTEIARSSAEWSSRLHPDERAPVMAALSDTLEGRSPMFHIEHRMKHRDGHWVWVLDSGCVVERDAEGRPIVMTGTLLDISERREAENRVRVLMRELDHRAKNLLAVVYSLINLMRAESVDAFKAAILGRVQALGHVHSLLSESAWQGIEIGHLIATETAAYQSSQTPRVEQDGPPLVLTPSAAQALAITVHELMTNSAKYGALSAPVGIARLTWRQANTPDGTVHMRWEDIGGPPVTEPRTKGFGTTLLATMVTNQLEGSLTMDWAPQGIVVSLSFPPENLRQADRPFVLQSGDVA